MKRLTLTLLLLLYALSAMAADAPPFGPNPQMTPGATLPVTVLQICAPGYAKTARNVPDSEKLAVYHEYGMPGPRTGYCNGPHGCEVDHLISLELGGSNDIRNLWPQPYDGPFNAHVKDLVENATHRAVCNGGMSLQDAQHAIASDWHALYLELKLKGVIK